MTRSDKENEGTSKPPPSDDSSSLRMMATMGGIGLVSGVLIVATYQLTLPVIKENKARALDAAVVEIVEGCKRKQAFEIHDDGALTPLSEDEQETVTDKLFACYDEHDKLVGTAIEARGQGFQDTLVLLYGYSLECECIVGFKVLESRETPGLGDKIETDKDFLKNFEALEVVLGEDKSEVVEPIVMVKKGEKTKPFQIDAITGATISSRAVAAILRKSTATLAPIIHAHRDVLEAEAKGRAEGKVEDKDAKAKVEEVEDGK